MNEESARARVLGMLKLERGLDVEAIAALCDGSRFAPEPLSDGERAVMPAFGAYTGGLNVRDRAFAAVFGARAVTAHMLGEGRLYAFAVARCLAG